MYIMKASTGLSFDIPLANFDGKWTSAPDKAGEGHGDQEV